MMNRKLLILAITVLAFFGCSKSNDPVPEVVPPDNFKIVAYFPDYRDPEQVDISKYKMLTHLNYAFLVPKADGSLATLLQPARFATVMARAKQNGVKTGIAISGASATFVTMAASSTARTAFVNNVLGFVLSNNLDGVDMDWEYPRSSDGSAANFTLLMKELSDALHAKQKYLSAAITAGVYAGAVRDGIESAVYPYVDFFNVMSYDGIGWDKTDPNQHASYNMAVSSLDVWLNIKGIPKEKVVLGMPCYGRNAANASITFRDVEAMGGNLDLDFVMKDGSMFYYNGPATIKKKTTLAKTRANGIMFWEFYGDSNTSNSLLKAANDAIGRKY